MELITKFKPQFFVYIIVICHSLMAMSQSEGFSRANRETVRHELVNNGGLKREDIARMATVAIESPYLTSEVKFTVLSELGLKNWAEVAKDKGSVINRLSLNTLLEVSTSEIPLYEYEVPMNEVRSNVYEQYEKVKDLESLLFERNGKSFLRLPVQPLSDNNIYDNLLEELREKGVQVELVKSKMRALFTSSRSTLVYDPVKGNEFYLKLSLKKANGAFKDKILTGERVQSSTVYNEHIATIESKMGFETVQVMYETATVQLYTENEWQELNSEYYERGEKDLGIGLIIREASNSEGKKLVSASSLLSEELTAELARKNGYENTYEFVEKHLVIPLAEATAEFYYKTGLWADSAHSQNFLVEFDMNDRPTGRIFIRDFSFYVDKNYLGNFIVDGKYLSSTQKRDTKIEFALMHGMFKWASWLTRKGYKQLAETYYKKFGHSFERFAGVDVKFGELTQSVVDFEGRHRRFTGDKDNYSVDSNVEKPGLHYKFEVDVQERGQGKNHHFTFRDQGSKPIWRDNLFLKLNSNYIETVLLPAYPEHANILQKPMSFIYESLNQGSAHLIAELPEDIRLFFLKLIRVAVRQGDQKLIKAIDQAVTITSLSKLESLVEVVFMNTFNLKLEPLMLKLAQRAPIDLINKLTYKIYSNNHAVIYQRALIHIISHMENSAMNSFLNIVINDVNIGLYQEAVQRLLPRLSEAQIDKVAEMSTTAKAKNILKSISELKSNSLTANSCRVKTQ